MIAASKIKSKKSPSREEMRAFRESSLVDAESHTQPCTVFETHTVREFLIVLLSSFSNAQYTQCRLKSRSIMRWVFLCPFRPFRNSKIDVR